MELNVRFLAHRGMILPLGVLSGQFPGKCVLGRTIFFILAFLGAFPYVLFAGVTVRGTVTTTEGIPVQHALVTFLRTADSTVAFSGLTNTLGEYTIILTGIDEPAPAIREFQLRQNYPNPFSESTTIEFALERKEEIHVTIYDILGRAVKKYRETAAPGMNGFLQWDGTDEAGRKVAYGVYFYRMSTHHGTATRKMVYIRSHPLPGFSPLSQIKAWNPTKPRKSPAMEEYVVSIENADSTKPSIVPFRSEQVMVGEDAVLNFEVEEDVEERWELLGLENETITAIALHPTDSSIIYAGSMFNFSAGLQGKLFKSTDGGINWDTLLVGGSFRDVVLDPSNPDVMYAIPNIVVKSTDGGATWQARSNGMIIDFETRTQSIALDPQTPTTLYAGTGGPNGGTLYKSTDGGESWVNLYKSDDLTPGLRNGVVSLAIHPGDTQILYAGTAGSGLLLKSTDSGGTWSITGLGQTESIIDFVAIHPTDNETLLTGVRFQGLFQSGNGGTTWVRENLPSDIQGFRDLVLTEDGVGMYLATEEGCYFKGANNTWVERNEGLVQQSLNILALGNTHFLYTGRSTFNDMNGGIHRRNIGN